ncbi:hypothetical protein MRX96_006012 [Rhipicephalus microplus]
MCQSPNLRSRCLFPGDRHLGSENPLSNGDLVDKDYGIAKSHDEAYERTRSPEEVFAANQASAALSLNHFRSNGNWHSPVGTVGLGTNIIALLAAAFIECHDIKKRANNGESDIADAKRYLPDSGTINAEKSDHMHSGAPVRPSGAGIRSDAENSTELVQPISA